MKRKCEQKNITRELPVWSLLGAFFKIDVALSCMIKKTDKLKVSEWKCGKGNLFLNQLKGAQLAKKWTEPKWEIEMDRATFFSESTKEAPASAALTAFSTGDWHNNKFIIEPFSIKNIIICNGGGGQCNWQCGFLFWSSWVGLLQSESWSNVNWRKKKTFFFQNALQNWSFFGCWVELLEQTHFSSFLFAKVTKIGLGLLEVS